MRIVDNKRAHLLINNYQNLDLLKKMILDSAYTAVDPLMPTLRFRGTVVEAGNHGKGFKITGWQRNVSRLRKMDVSLPTIITLDLGGNGYIENIELDAGFAGSKGLICAHTYLNRRLKSLLQGQALDNTFIHRVKQENTHCSHLFEVLSGIYSYYNMLKENDFRELYPETYAYEEEVIDSYTENGTLYSLGTHLFKGKTPLTYQLTLHNILEKVGFAKNGVLTMNQGVEVDFSLNGVICVNGGNADYAGLSRFLLRCLARLRQEVCREKHMRMFNSNLYPGAYIGMLIQAIAIRLFNNNYNYIMHVLTALQRSGDRPLCVGALNNQEEANRWFPGFSFSELV